MDMGSDLDLYNSSYELLTIDLWWFSHIGATCTVNQCSLAVNQNTHHFPPPLASLLTLAVVTVSCSQHLFTATVFAHYQPSYQLHDSQPHLSLSICKFTEIQSHKKCHKHSAHLSRTATFLPAFFFFISHEPSAMMKKRTKDALKIDSLK